MHKFPFYAFQDVALRELFERSQQSSAGLSSARTAQGEVNAEPRQGQITATFSHADQSSGMGGHFIKLFSVLCKVCIQNTM